MDTTAGGGRRRTRGRRRPHDDRDEGNARDSRDSWDARDARDDDRGQMGGIEALPFGLLIFVVGMLLAANCWAVVSAKIATDAAAREATRRFVEAPVVDAGGVPAAAASAEAAGLAVLGAEGRQADRAAVALTGLDGPGGYVRCARVTFTATYRVPALTLPWIGGYGGGFEVRGTHSELVDPFRDGVPGEAVACG